MRLSKSRLFLIAAVCILLLVLAGVVSDRIAHPPDPLAAQQEVTRQTNTGMDALQKARETGDPTYYAQADTAFAAALNLDSKNQDALIGKGLLALARHQFRDALALGEQARAVAPSRALVYGVIGDAQVELGMYDEAVKTVQTMVDMRPDLNSYSRASYVRELKGDVDGAMRLMQEAITSGAPNKENVQWTRVQLGNLYFNKGDLTGAEYLYRQALAALPGYIYAQAGLAQVRTAQGRYDEAIDLYTQATAKIPLPQFVIALGETQEAAGHPAEAAKQYDLARFENKLFASNGVNVDMELALFEADHGDAKHAVEQARQAYKDRPSVKAADTLAWALSQAGQQDEAARYSQEALRLGTKDALFHYHAGMIAFRAGNMTGARQQLEQALAINPYFSPIYAATARQTLAQAQAK